MAGSRTYNKRSGAFGVEIETETLDAYTAPAFEYWQVHDDGSLRNFGVEYVLHSPLNFQSEDWKAAFKEFASQTKRLKFLDSVYTSVHVHCNMQNIHMKKIFNFMGLYLFFEDILSAYCGPDRDGNLFCLKNSSAEAVYREVCQTVRMADVSAANARHTIRNLNPNILKYSSMNIAPLGKFGSVEIRTHGGTTDLGEVDRWVGILNCVYKAAQRYDNPLHVLNTVRTLGYKKFFESVFEEYGKYLDTKDLDDKLDKSLYYLASIVMSAKDWNNEKMFYYDAKEEATSTTGNTFRILTDITVDELDRDIVWNQRDNEPNRTVRPPRGTIYTTYATGGADVTTQRIRATNAGLARNDATPAAPATPTNNTTINYTDLDRLLTDLEVPLRTSAYVLRDEDL